MLNHDSTISKFKDAFMDQQSFIRPVLDSKSFSGQLMNPEDFYDWKRKVVVLEHDYGNSLDSETVIQISSIKEIYAEYRFWIVNGKISTASLYKLGDRLVYANIDNHEFLDPLIFVKQHTPVTEVIDYVIARINEWLPLSSFVIDVADTPEGIKIIEINTINSSGFYSADLSKLVLDFENAYTTSDGVGVGSTKPD